MNPETKRRLWCFWMDMEQEERDEEIGNPDNSFQEFKKHFPAVAKDLEKHRLENAQPTK